MTPSTDLVVSVGRLGQLGGIVGGKGWAGRVRSKVGTVFVRTANLETVYCTVLYCTVLYCTVLYCTVLHCTVLYCTTVEGFITILLFMSDIDKYKKHIWLHD